MNFLKIKAGITATAEIIKHAGISNNKFCGSTTKLPPLIIEHTGNISVKSIILAPTIFPTPKSPCFFYNGSYCRN